MSMINANKAVIEQYVRFHKLNADNFQTFTRDITAMYGKKTFLFLVNKSFVGPFYSDKTEISELVNASEFVLEVEGESHYSVVTKDAYGMQGGAYGSTESLIHRLSDTPKEVRTTQQKDVEISDPPVYGMGSDYINYYDQV